MVPHIDTFTLVTGLATLISFAVQVWDLFPRLGKWRESTFLLLLGVLFGSFLRAFDASRIVMDVKVSFGVVVLISLSAFIVAFLALAADAKDAQRRGEYYVVSIVGGLAWAVALIGVAIGNIPGNTYNFPDLSVSELSYLADRAEQTKDYDRAIARLEALKRRVLGEADIQQKIDQRIKEDRARQLDQ